MHFTDKHWNLLAGCRFLMCVLLFSSCITFAQEATKSNTSGLQSLNVTNGLVLLDVASAFYVLVGFSASIFLDHDPKFNRQVYTGWFVGVLHLWTMVCMGAIASVFVWPLFTVPRGQQLTNLSNVALTFLEVLCGVRVFETSQDQNAWHTLNSTSWPIHCLLLPGVWIPGARKLAIALRQRNMPIALLLPFSVITGIMVSSTLAVVNSNTNLFYALASSSFYRLLECLAGMHLHIFVRETQPQSPIMLLSQRICFWPVLVFMLLWWVEVGAPWQTDTDVCLRVYYFQHCWQDAQGGLARGCILGMLLAMHLYSTDNAIHKHIVLPREGVLAAALVFAWPISNISLVSLNGSLSQNVVFANGPLLAVICTAHSLAMGFVYDVFLSPACISFSLYVFRQCWHKVSACLPGPMVDSFVL